MAGDWIKMRLDLPDDPAVFKLSGITKLDRLSVIGRLYAFWTWADKHSVDGRVDGGASTVVDEIARHDGFADAMVQVGWLEVGDGYVAIPKHDRHNGESAKERGLKNARQSRWREQKSANPSTPVDGAVDGGASTPASTREEKRREEKNKVSRNTTSRKKTPAEYTAEFETFWSIYPRKVAKGDAAKSFEAAVRIMGLDRTAAVGKIIAAVNAQSRELAKDIKFCPYPATWLNDRRYDDSLEEVYHDRTPTKEQLENYNPHDGGISW